MAEEALQELEQAYESDDDQGPEIQEKLASIAERMKKGNLAEGKLKEKMDRQKKTGKLYFECAQSKTRNMGYDGPCC